MSDEGVRVRLRLSGSLEMRLEGTRAVSLDAVEARTGGTFDAPEPPFELTLEGALGELRALAPASGALAALARRLEGMADDVPAEATLRAKPGQVAELGRLARGVEMNDLPSNVAWMTRLFDLEAYEAYSISVPSS